MFVVEFHFNVDRLHDDHNMHARDKVRSAGRVEEGEDGGHNVKKRVKKKPRGDGLKLKRIRREGVTGLSRNKILIIIITIIINLLPVCMLKSSGEHFTAAAD